MKCIDTKTKARDILPLRRSERFEMLDRFGDEAFLFPGGTPATDQPSFPVMTKDGCLSCSLLRAAYLRLSQSKAHYPEKTKKIEIEKRKVVKTALKLADKHDRTNLCNWSYTAMRRLTK